MAERGGRRAGAGRKTKAQEAQANEIMKKALKRIYKEDEDEEAKIKFIETLLESQRGQIFVAEHLFGKAPQEVVQTNLNLDKGDLTNEQITEIVKAYKEEY